MTHTRDTGRPKTLAEHNEQDLFALPIVLLWVLGLPIMVFLAYLVYEGFLADSELKICNLTSKDLWINEIFVDGRRRLVSIPLFHGTPSIPESFHRAELSLSFNAPGREITLVI